MPNKFIIETKYKFFTIFFTFMDFTKMQHLLQEHEYYIVEYVTCTLLKIVRVYSNTSLIGRYKKCILISVSSSVRQVVCRSEESCSCRVGEWVANGLRVGCQQVACCLFQGIKGSMLLTTLLTYILYLD